MTANEPAAGQAEPATGRFVLGTGVFVFGMLCPLFIPLVATSALSTEWKTALSGVLLLGAPEVLILVAVAILGKPGYEAMKRRLLSVLGRLRPVDRRNRTSPRRRSDVRASRARRLALSVHRPLAHFAGGVRAPARPDPGRDLFQQSLRPGG